MQKGVLKMKKVNCLSFAMKLENIPDLDVSPNLDFHLSPEEAISKLAERFGMGSRKLASENSPLEKGEWLIAFWGFIYFYDSDNYGLFSCVPDYHFACKGDDGIWRERMSWSAPIEEIDFSKLVEDFKKAGYPVQFFALRKTVAN